MSVRILEGDALTVLRTLPDQSVQCCVTSPPYFGLRDYGVSGQLGLEKTPQLYVDAMVGVFSEVKRVLRDDGTLWLNIGDSYAGSWGNYGGQNRGKGTQRAITKGSAAPNPAYDGLEKYLPATASVAGCKPKDLIGIPWALATALRAPRYTGEIKSELDRVWLAATIDAEGCISGFRHERKDDGRIRTGVNVTITNTSERLLDEATRIWPASRHDHMSGERLGTRPVWRWIATNVDRNAMLMRELYPYLVVKRVQALLAYNLFELSKVAKRDGQTSEGTASRGRRDALVAAISELNQGRDIDIPSWCVEPPTPTEPGWYLRSDIIWAKPNPMPESVTDRPTKSHEYLFLLSKSSTYFYDADAIAEQVAESQVGRVRADVVGGISHAERGQHSKGGTYRGSSFTRGKTGVNGNGRTQPDDERADTEGLSNTRNRRSVWTVSTQPYSEAHFATFPPKLIEPCILAGSAKGQTVLDPFGGAGTTGLVADRLGRDALLIELNPKYAEMARKRITSDNPLFTDVA